MASTISEYADSLPSDKAEIVAKLADIVRAAVPEAEEAIKWGQPVFSKDGPFCFIKAHKAHVNLGFWWGIKISDPTQVLEGSGDKMRHIKVRDGADIDETLFARLRDPRALRIPARVGWRNHVPGRRSHLPWVRAR